MAPLSSGVASTVLVVEDDPLAMRLIKEAFGESGTRLTPIAASDGVEAFDVLYNRGEYADTPPPVLVLLDLNLPGRSGQQILTEIREDATLQSLPVIVFSSITDPDTIAECYRLGANAYVVKPVDFEGTLTVVKRLTDFWVKTAETPPG